MRGFGNRLLRRAGWILLLLALATAAAGCVTSKDTQSKDRSARLGSGVVAKIDGEGVPLADLELRASVFALIFQQPAPSAEERKQLVEQLVVQRLLAKDAQRQNLTVETKKADEEYAGLQKALVDRYENQEALNNQMAELKITEQSLRSWFDEALLAQHAAETFMDKVTISEDEVKQFYDQNKDSMYTFTEDTVRARHILLDETEEEKAKQLAEQAKSGADFAQLAKEHSKDSGSGVNGGDLGFFKKSDMVPAFADVAFALKVNEIGGPVKSQFGWHIIKVEEHRGAGVLPFDDAKTDVKAKLLPEKQQEQLGNHIEKLRADAKVEISDTP